MSKARPTSEIIKDIQAIHKMLPGLWRLLIEVDDFAHSAGGGAEAGRGGSISDSDPTGDVAAAKGNARSKRRAMDYQISAGLSRLLEAEASGHAAFLPKDHRSSYEETFRPSGPLASDRVVHLSEVNAAREAQMKRQRRGEM